MREQLLAAEQVQALEWRDDGLFVLDAREIPAQQCWQAIASIEQAIEAVAEGVVVEGSIVGLLAAYTLVLEARAQRVVDCVQLAERLALFEGLPVDSAALEWAMLRLREALQRAQVSVDPLQVFEQAAKALHASDREANLALAQYGVELMRRHQADSQVVMTHGYGGVLACGGVGTSLALLRAADEEGLIEHVFACESRPLGDGGRLVAWELSRAGVPVTAVVDAAAAHVMKVAGVTWVLVGAKRIAANGDLIADVGSYQLAINAMHHGVRFAVVAATSSFDLTLENADDYGQDSCMDDAINEERWILSPSEDVTPVDLIDYIITERGVIERPDAEKIAHALCRKRLH